MRTTAGSQRRLLVLPGSGHRDGRKSLVKSEA